jgi:hypothetical protein
MTLSIREIENIIGQCQAPSGGHQKEASSEPTSESLSDRVSRVTSALQTEGTKIAGAGFYEQLGLMEKRASQVARGHLGLDPSNVGDLNPIEQIELAFGVKA